MDEYRDARWYASITQRGRGVYLANVGETRDGNEQWDAFSSLAAAKRWCASQMDRKRLRWEDVSKPGQWPRWYTEIFE